MIKTEIELLVTFDVLQVVYIVLYKSAIIYLNES